MRKTHYYLLISAVFLFSASAFADLRKIDGLRFISYDKVPTWVGVAINWQSAPEIHIYDKNEYKGHADYISKGLETGITFRQFKDEVRNFETRKYLPFLLFDLRDLNVQINEKPYGWAVQIQEYEFVDTTAQMEETALKLAGILDSYVNSDSPVRHKGLFILSLSEKAAANFSIAPALNKKGYPNKTLRELLDLVCVKRFFVLTPGIGVGYLKFVKAGQMEHARLSPKDIVIYETIPNRVPPVAGIITLAPQTELSHVNLLAKNRGTFNVYADNLDFIPGLEAALGKLVMIECTENNVGIKEINMDRAESFWRNSKVSSVDIPAPNLSIRRIVDLGKKNSKYHRVKFIGAKAANYALIQAAFPEYVRPGFALPFSHYDNLIKTGGAKKLIQTLSDRKKEISMHDKDRLLAEIRQQISDAMIHPDTITAIRWLQARKFPQTKIRLRSSTNCEDLPQFNGAGLYISKGLKPTQGNRKLIGKILNVYASLWSNMAFDEREFYGIDHTKAGMAILIHEAFVREYANGVAITIPRDSGYGVLINAQKGENQVTNPETGHIPESVYFENNEDETRTVRSRSNIGDIFAGNPGLEPLLLQLRSITAKTHDMLVNRLPEYERTNYGVDIEFKIMRENKGFRLYIKQARLLGSALPG